jgi:hypothetical protein
MNMNRAAVDAALGYAGNMPLTDDDKKYRNLIYIFCLNLYLPTLFNSLCEIDWRCARKYALLHETKRFTIREEGKYYYEMPADCLKPLFVDDNETNFRNDTDFLITNLPVEKLYYVFHKRKARGGAALTAPVDTEQSDALPYISASPSYIDGAGASSVIKARADEAPSPAPGEEEDFPDWEYTAYDEDLWQYFSYKLAARLIPKLRSDDGSAGRARALEAIARQTGEQAIERSRGAAANPAQPTKSWAERAGITTTKRPAYYRDYPPYSGVF